MLASRTRALITLGLVLVVAALPALAEALGNPSLPANPCLAGKIKCVTKRTKCLIGCYAKAAKAGVALNTSSDACLVKCREKFDGGASGPAASCFGKLEAKGGCLHGGDGDAIGVKSDGFVLSAVAKLDPAPLDNASSCRSGKLKCVSKYDQCVQGLFAKAAKAGGQIDPGKLAKCRTVVTGGSKGVPGSCFGKLDAKGNCETAADGGALAAQDDASIDEILADLTSGPTDVHNERCSGDTSVKCTGAPGGVAGCGGGLGTCEFWFGGPQSLAVGGISLCATNQWSGAVTGTINPESGAAGWSGTLKTGLYNGLTNFSPCPQCDGDTSLNDGLADGTCSAGIHAGAACDANGVTSVAVFGATSLDCPPLAGAAISFQQLKLSSNNTAASLTLSAASPDCTAFGAEGKKCACAACSGNTTVACASNADCSAVSAGTCTSFAGEPREPNACIDDTTTPGDGSCVDVAPVGDGVAECSEGPGDQFCAVESFRGCTTLTQATDCPLPGDFCTYRSRRCYLDNGVIGGTIVAVGAHSSPVNHASFGTFASVHCIAPIGASAVNSIFGLPGAGRLTIGGLLTENGTTGSCPTRAAFVVTDADGVQDIGWNGFGHDQRYVTRAKLAMNVTGCSGSAPSCGDCTLTGPVLNPSVVAETVFVTSGLFAGNLGGLAGADAICATAATNAGLSGTFKAWLSDSTTSAGSRILHTTNRPYVRVDGVLVAGNWADLTDGTLSAPISVTETGASVGAADVWTATAADGSLKLNGGAAPCNDWTSSNAALPESLTGATTVTDSRWTDNVFTLDCGAAEHLFCVASE